MPLSSMEKKQAVCVLIQTAEANTSSSDHRGATLNKKRYFVIAFVLLLALNGCVSSFESCMSSCRDVYAPNHLQNSTCFTLNEVIKEVTKEEKPTGFACNQLNVSSLRKQCFEVCNGRP